MKTKSLLLIFGSLAYVIGLSGCSTIFSRMYGMRKLKMIEENTILQYSQKYSIPTVDSYELDTSYISFLASLDTGQYKEEIKNHHQPLQALYFDRAGQLQSFQINCYAGGFPNLSWNRNEIMTTFPPKQQAPLDTIVSLESQLKYLRPLPPTEGFSIDSYDNVVIVYWNRFMGRQSKRLVRVVQENVKLATGKKVKIIYANSDNLFAGKSPMHNAGYQ